LQFKYSLFQYFQFLLNKAPVSVFKLFCMNLDDKYNLLKIISMFIKWPICKTNLQFVLQYFISADYQYMASSGAQKLSEAIFSIRFHPEAS